MQYLLALFIGEGYILKFHPAAVLIGSHILHLHRIRSIIHGNRLVHGLKDTLQISDIVDKVVEDISKVHYGLPET